jgi:hypothetical protein
MRLMGYCFAKELRPHDIAAVSIWMGGLDTERTRAYLASLPDESRPKTKRESPQFTGKVIAALYESNLRMKLSGRALIGVELGAKIGVSDIDGSTPKSYQDELGGPPELHPTHILMVIFISTEKNPGVVKSPFFGHVSMPLRTE